MKKKSLIITLFTALILAVIAVFVFADKNSADKPASDIASSPGSDTTLSESELSEISEKLKNTAVISVYAPEGATVMLDGKEMPYSDAVDCHRIIDTLSGKCTLTVTRDGYEKYERVLDLDKEKNHEITVELTVLESIKEDAAKKAEELLPELIKICDNKSGDLSSFSFYSESEKAAIQSTVDDIIYGLSVDTENYKTGEIKLHNIIYDDSSSVGDSISQENGSPGRLIKFKAEYSYNWEFASDSYKNSGTDTLTADGLIVLDYINGQWCIREFYLPLRKNVH